MSRLPAAADWVSYLDGLAVFGMRPGLERVEALLARLGRPEQTFRSIHVVGTNGKSSTTRYAAAVLSAHGLRSGAYLSPHINGYAERVLVDGRPVREDVFGDAVTMVRTSVADLPAELGETTQFEVLTVAALLSLAREGVEVAAVEAGLGGRLDATNILAAPVVVVTNIGLEHTDVLGDTRELIFAEKAAVITPDADVVFGDLEGLDVMARDVCRAVGARAHLLDRDILLDLGKATPATAGDAALAEATEHGFEVRIRGVPGDSSAAGYSGLRVPSAALYQKTNAALAVAACHFLLGGLDATAVRRGLARTAVPGRLQVVRRAPLVLADGAHNPHGMAALAASLTTVERPRPRVALLSMLSDKAVDEMLVVLSPLVERVVCTRSSEPRSLSAEELRERAVAVLGGRAAVTAVGDPQAAYAAALSAAGSHGSVLIAGSLYLLEELADVLSAADDARVY